MNRYFGLIAFLILGVSTYISLSGHHLGMAIHRWQASIIGDGSYFPALTIFVLAIPPLLILALIKYVMTQKKRKL